MPEHLEVLSRTLFDLMRRVTRTCRVVEEEGLICRRAVRILEEPNRPVGEVDVEMVQRSPRAATRSMFGVSTRPPIYLLERLRPDTAAPIACLPRIAAQSAQSNC